jgi:plastocyanin domain-containing protein
MTVTDWTVVAAGVALIGWINWYFFLTRPAVVRAEVKGGVQTVPIVVEGGYQPADIRVTAGKPVRLLFERRDTSPCSEEVVLSGFGMKRYLPADRTTAVEFVPAAAGSFEFTCGMSMLRGRITVVPAEGR